jgi:hypothetical protein
VEDVFGGECQGATKEGGDRRIVAAAVYDRAFFRMSNEIIVKPS